MSEYQYYEFRKIDGRLTEKQIEELRRYSTRASITATSFINEYHFGDFKGDTNRWMDIYFDAFLHLASWGTRYLQVALPAKLVPRKTAQLYCADGVVSMREKSGKLIFDFLLEEEPDGEWLEGDGILSGLLPIRTELAHGDFRSLYLGWLMAVQIGQLEDSVSEPPLPPNLADLSGAQEDFADFFGLDRDLLDSAARNSPRIETKPAKGDEISAWVASIPAHEKDEILIRMIGGEQPVATEIQARFERQRHATKLPPPKPRTVADLLAAAKAHRAERERRQAQQTARDKEQEQRLAAMAREKHLDSLQGQSEAIWASVKSLAATRLPKSYDQAVKEVIDLRDLAQRESRQADFTQQLALFRAEHPGKKTLLDRLTKAGL